ncbi:DUF4395 family protein [Lysinibacillus sphaericus]|uniref:DUF4395 family protein n=1 Tax=Lysinibacillus sphaericus TaxID=1421 RepID=UPI001E41A0D4|nr:DUF4395 family protein [Lysinibacillus sphaericus]
MSIILTWTTGVVWLLAIPLVANFLGVLCNFNPIIRLGKQFLKKAPSAYIPEDAQQQKFNSSIASFCLAGGFLGFFFHWQIVGYTFTAVVAIASSVAIAGFCFGFFYIFN